MLHRCWFKISINSKVNLLYCGYFDKVFNKFSTISGGIRTYTLPGSSDRVKTYIRCRKTGETTERGELSKTYYDNQ